MDDFEQVKRDTAEAQRKLDQLLGQYKEKRRWLRKKFNCKTLKEAEKLHPEVHKQMMDKARIYLKKKKVHDRELKRAKRKLK